ncbi:MAG TPA: porin, partial [Capsulimonadaceae bacterium]|nr:porin [Capsulimonadaceae bacterium]
MKSHRIKTCRVLASLAAAFAGVLALGAPAFAQNASFPDTPKNHWAYQAVTDLANKGYVKGYPNGKFFGGRVLTRYEFATVIDRMVQELDDLSQKVANGQAPATPTGAQVTQDDLNRIQGLVDSFKEQLTAIQSSAAMQAAQFQGEIDKLHSEITAVKTEADNSYGAGSGRKFAISGYVQARYIQSASSNSKNFPQGQPAASSPYNGNYAAGGNNESFVVRRARLRVNGQINKNSAYAVQIDLSGFANNSPSSSSNSSNASVSSREAWVSYTPGSGDTSRNPTFEAGQFSNPFGFVL